ncbi:hypothetical protein J2T10_004190 [Paenarthrobacter nicotinovorans]|uniref:Uncharacterized protein n=1 Tax=Paenarthrobacter nicotinovorans TaxID=29320 RepID=A0ABT9TS56_PAENI|nr:hypothetical protein [Paenarthrobacter nicotinovorans]MDQ0104515.1 hypothetical protein [Paenarthrobacter nicotinovorans]
MGIRHILSRHRKAVGPSAAAPAGKSAELEAAWAELRQMVDESNVTSFRACSRNGGSWAEDPEAVRQIAATIGRIMKDTAEGPKGTPAR